MIDRDFDESNQSNVDEYTEPTLKRAFHIDVCGGITTVTITGFNMFELLGTLEVHVIDLKMKIHKEMNRKIKLETKEPDA